MKSHEYAAELQKTIDHILSKPDLELEEHAGPHLYMYFYTKEKFIAFARAMGGGKKSFSNYGSEELHFEPTGTCLLLSIARSLVCRKIQDVKWECEPLLSSEEIEQLGESEESVF